MLLTEEQLSEIEEMAALLFDAETIALNIEAEDVEAFVAQINIKQGEAFKAFFRGRMRTEIELRSAIKQSALNGSNPAQAVMLSFISTSEL